jgi:hypothetical protein
MFATLFCSIREGSGSGTCGSFWGWGDFIVDLWCCGQLAFFLYIVWLECLPLIIFALQFDLTFRSCFVRVLHYSLV